jgi:hypothetical protein
MLIIFRYVTKQGYLIEKEKTMTALTTQLRPSDIHFVLSRKPEKTTLTMPSEGDRANRTVPVTVKLLPKERFCCDCATD